ncbi:MAG: SEC-C metal-binding domain-containing protein [Desulfosporosinus sp.]|nr:SEC-C metal-binding domain-containing protein [Desulfosporosinus sp.]
MINLPIFCNACGAIFPSGIVVENLTNAIINDISGSCPFCGGFGQVPAGVYNFIGRTIGLLTGPDTTVNELNKLAIILQNYQDKESGVNEIRQQIYQEVPKLTSIVDLLPSQDAYQFIQIILFIITIIITLALEDEPAPITTENIIEELYKRLTPSNTLPTDSPNDKKSKNFQVANVGRNDLCTCGSGKKYKKCCGNIII